MPTLKQQIITIFLLLLFIIQQTYSLDDQQIYNQVIELNGSISQVMSIAITRDGNTIVAGTKAEDSSLRVYQLNGSKMIMKQQLYIANASFVDIQITDNGSHIFASDSKSGYLMIWKYNTKNYQNMTWITQQRFRQVDISDDANIIVMANTRRYFVIYQFNGVQYKVLDNFTMTYWVIDISMTGDGIYIAIGMAHRVEIYKKINGSYGFYQALDITIPVIFSVKITDNYQYLISGEQNGNISIYNYNGSYFNLKDNLMYLVGTFQSVTMSEDCLHIVAAGLNGSSYIASFNNGKFSWKQYVIASRLIRITPQSQVLVAPNENSSYAYFNCSLNYCSECSWKDKCKKCIETFDLQQNQTCACPELYSIYNSRCIKCLPLTNYCLRCEKENQCAQCKESFILTNNFCQCNQTQFKKISKNTNMCVQCHPHHCDWCDDINKCAHCEKGKIVSSKSWDCVECLVTNCDACGQANQCTHCINGFSVNIQSHICECPVGRTISSDEECVECFIDECIQCNSPNKCEVCHGILFTDQHKTRCQLRSDFWIFCGVCVGELMICLVVMCLVMRKLLKAYYTSDYVQSTIIDNYGERVLLIQ